MTKLQIKDIVDKEFTVDYKGYNAKEVDLFLDLIIGDYEIQNNLIAKLKKDNISLEKINQEIIKENNNFKNEILTLKKQKEKLEAKGLENVDIITRLSKLESIVHDD